MIPYPGRARALVEGYATAGPLCPYGQVAAHQGSGSTDDAANFACVAAGAARPSTARQ